MRKDFLELTFQSVHLVAPVILCNFQIDMNRLTICKSVYKVSHWGSLERSRRVNLREDQNCKTEKVFKNVSYDDQGMYFSEFWNGQVLYQTKLHWIHVMPYAGIQLETRVRRSVLKFNKKFLSIFLK